MDTGSSSARGAQAQVTCHKASTALALAHLGSYDELVKAIIRPPRAEYEMDELGPERFEFAGVSFERQDLQLRNGRGLALQSSTHNVNNETGNRCVERACERAPNSRSLRF